MSKFTDYPQEGLQRHQVRTGNPRFAPDPEMIERIAFVLYLADCGAPPDPDEWEEFMGSGYREMAIHAIKAVRDWDAKHK